MLRFVSGQSPVTDVPTHGIVSDDVQRGFAAPALRVLSNERYVFDGFALGRCLRSATGA